MASSPTGARDAAIADALDEAARVLVRLAARLRAAHEQPPSAARPAARARRERLQPLGPRQRAVLGLGGLGDEQGLAASEVATALGYTASNATNILKRLEQLGHVVRVPDGRPARWRRPTPTAGR